MVEYRSIGPRSTFDWNNWVPKKVCFVAWRASLDRLPTVSALRRRNISIQNPMCRLCGDFEETLEHLFVSCQFSQTIWHLISQWCHLPPIFAFHFHDLITIHQNLGGSKKRRKVYHAIILTVLWSLWRTRNNAVFNNKPPQVTAVIEESKSLSYLWIKNRSKTGALSWDAWKKCELSLFG
ncbi:putative reverse transcriptase zinc-binding domain-containing protein [Helianthus annuus]|nr:putative reverse transcriptase zinc-binding domain-containing protein [Helianthus annuus]